MKKAVGVVKWIGRNFYLLPIPILVVIFWRWFQLTPLMFFNDPDYAYIVGLVLFGLYGLFAVLARLSRKRPWLEAVLLIPLVFFLLEAARHTRVFFPEVKNVASCNGRTYYITWMSPFGDEQWTFDNITIWKGPFRYESFFFTYTTQSYEIVCDQELGETNIVSTMRDVLVYTDGADPRDYDEYVGTTLRAHRYFLARECNDWVPSTCGSLTYTLYECNLGYKDCRSLAIQYTQYETRDFLRLVSDERDRTINLYEEDFETGQEHLIFSFSRQPRCYVEDCEILEK